MSESAHKWLGPRMLLAGVLCLAMLLFHLYVMYTRDRMLLGIPGAAIMVVAGPWFIHQGWRRIKAGE